MNKLKRDLPIYVLSASLILSSVLYATQAQSSPQYVTTTQHKKDLKAIVQVIVEQEGKISNTQDELNSLRDCVNGISFVIENKLRISCS